MIGKPRRLSEGPAESRQPAAQNVKRGTHAVSRNITTVAADFWRVPLRGNVPTEQVAA